MKLRKSIWAAVVLIFLLVLTGCSQNQQVIFNAAMNMQNVKSMQGHTTMTFQFSGSGFEPTVQQQIDQAAMFLNNAKLDIDVKTNGNEDKTISKSQLAINFAAQGMNINIPCWVDSDLTGTTPKINEIFKIPQIAAGFLPAQFANKEYMVIDPSNMSSLGLSNSIDITKLTEFAKTFQSEEVAFLNSYAQRFNPDIDVTSMGTQTIQTNDGPKEAQMYQIKLSDAQFKNLIRYSVTNFAQDPEAINFIKEFLDQSLAISNVPDQAKTKSEFDQAFNEFKANMPQFLSKFSNIMDQLNGVSILGDNGIELTYAISEGYLIQESGSMDFKIDLAQVIQLLNNLNGQQNSTAATNGTLNLKINYNSDISNINSPLVIDIPQVNSDNSFDYFDLIKSLAVGSNASNRLAGQDRYETAKVIGESYHNGVCSNIILVSGNNFPDALSASILSKKYDAPILLVGATPGQSSEAFSFIASHSNPDTKIYIIGGNGVIDKSFETALNNSGLSNIERLSGNDRYDVNMAVVNKANVDPGTPVFIASGEGFPDALSVSGFAGAKQYPILLAGQNNLSDKTISYLTSNKPSAVYIVGGESVVSQAVEEQIKNLLPTAAIKRLAGNNRFETNAIVANQFSTNPQIIYLANGLNYPDALAGSTLAAKDGNPILLIDNNSQTLPPAVVVYLEKLRDSGNHPQIKALGGTGVVSDTLIQQANLLMEIRQ